MNVRTMIETAVGTLDPKDQTRMRAAMELGARFAIEAVIIRSGYCNDELRAVLAELDGVKSPVEEPSTAPTAPVTTEPEPAIAF